MILFYKDQDNIKRTFRGSITQIEVFINKSSPKVWSVYHENLYGKTLENTKDRKELLVAHNSNYWRKQNVRTNFKNGKILR